MELFILFTSFGLLFPCLLTILLDHTMKSLGNKKKTEWANFRCHSSNYKEKKLNKNS